MKKLLFTLAAATMLTTPALAADAKVETSATVKADKTAKSDTMMIVEVDGLVENTNVEYMASEGIGRDVFSTKMKKIGEVKDMGITADGRVEYVIVGFDKGLFDPETDKAVPHDMLVWNEGENKLVYQGNVAAATSANVNANSAAKGTLDETENTAKGLLNKTEKTAKDAMNKTEKMAKDAKAKVDASVDADADAEVNTDE